MTQTVAPPFETLDLSPQLLRDLRSDHAGETGAVWIYHGILRVSSDPQVRAFATEHLETEKVHLAFFDQWLPRRLHSRLLPAWKLAAWMLGALPALLGRRWVFVTIEAVEKFVVTHYASQIQTLRQGSVDERALGRVLARFQEEEAAHRADAASRQRRSMPPLAAAWQALIGGGSRLAVMLARAV